MKLYTPPEMSKKLVEMGCVSQSMFCWKFDEDGKCWVIRNRGIGSRENLPAFEFEDFAGPWEQAIENAKRVWGNEKCEPDSPNYRCYECKRTTLQNEKNWVEEIGRWL